MTKRYCILQFDVCICTACVCVVCVVFVCGSDLEHEGVAKLDGQFELFDEVRVVEGGYAEVVPLFFLPDPVEGLLLGIYTQRVAGGLQQMTGRVSDRVIKVANFLAETHTLLLLSYTPLEYYRHTPHYVSRFHIHQTVKANVYTVPE